MSTDRTDPADRPAVPGLEPADGRTRPLDPSRDPDRYLPPGQGQSLPELIGEAATHEGERDNYQWAIGLIAVFVFLGLVAFLFSNVLTP